MHCTGLIEDEQSPIVDYVLKLREHRLAGDLGQDVARRLGSPTPDLLVDVKVRRSGTCCLINVVFGPCYVGIVFRDGSSLPHS